MEGLSAAASVIAVSSLAFQLAEGTKKLFEFWDSIQNAPEEVNDIKLELESLTIKSLTADIESGFASSKIYTRKWSALQAVLSRKKMEKVQRSLERLKATLLLVLVNNVG